MPILREYLLRGGTLTFDDFHGPIEWANLERELKRVFPDRKIVDLPQGPSDFQLLLQDVDGFPQTPGLGSFLQGRTWEKGGYVATLRAIEDDNGRAMVLINWNVDMGDGWEWSNATEYPGYVKYTAHGVPDGDQRNHLLADTLMHGHHPDDGHCRRRRARRRRARPHPRRDPQGRSSARTRSSTRC